MNKYAQIKYGKIIYFYHSDLDIKELSSIFSPKTFWIDVTNIECELGWEVSYDAECKMILKPPAAPAAPAEPEMNEPDFEQVKEDWVTTVKNLTAEKITCGFISTCYEGQNILYDTDVETQLTMTIAKSCCESERFKKELPNGLEVRGYEQIGVDEDGTLVFSKDKTIFYFNPEQIKTWHEDFALFLRECKKEGWMKQAEVAACTTIEELEEIDLDW